MAVTTETVIGSHVLTIDGYTKTAAALAVGERIQSETFHVGGHGWYIECYPRGQDEEVADWVSVLLCLDHHSLSHNVKPSHKFVLVDRAGQAILMSHGSWSWHGQEQEHTTYSTVDGFPSAWGTSEFVERKTLESYLIIQGDDCCRIRCDVALVREQEPPPPSSAGLGDLLLASEVGRDVTLVVGGEQFTAHRCVLAARSSTAFMEEVLLGTGNAKDSAAVVDGIQPRVFKALHHFIYTDSLPVPDDELADHGDRIAVVQGLLAAADRYDMARLKLICCDLLLATEVGRDVTFVVSGSLFTAHSCVLAARSSLAFMAKVLGTGKESGGCSHVQVSSVAPRAFKALLDFIYTDSVADHVIADGLLAEADRYGMERLKMICADVLCGDINATTALHTLRVAKKHGCLKLNQACAKFIRGMLDAFNMEETK